MQGTTLNILMVEDDRVMRAVIHEMLKHTDLHFELTIAETGKSAIQYISDQDFNCVLLDYELPDMNAKTILHEAQLDKNNTLPIIILTAHNWSKLATDLISLGATDFISKQECSSDKLERSIIYAISRKERQNKQVADEISNISNQLDVYSEEVAFLSNYDKLTSLPNRECFNNDLNKAIARSNRHKLQVSLLYIDIDNFQHFNDSYDYSTGDRILVEISQRIVTAVRKNDLVCRIGEDKFAVYLDHTKKYDDAAIAAQKIMKELSKPIKTYKHEHSITCSIGIVHQSGTIERGNVLITHAQTAVSTAKANGKNCFVYYSDEMTQRAKFRLSLENKLRKAIENNELSMHYQPKVCLKTGLVEGAEALLRWHHPVDGFISPADFIPIAEESDLILDIDTWIFNTVMKQIIHWQNAGFTVPVLSINIPSREFQRGDLFHKFSSCLKKHQISGESIELEITERLLVEYSKSTEDTIQKIKDLGTAISMDDFGTGYSSLSYLAKFPFDIIKIDKTFIDQTPHCPENCAIVESIIFLAHSLNKKAVAEGVETEEQYQYIKSIGCDQIQGYYFSKPLTVDLFEELLLKINCLKNTTNRHKAQQPSYK